MSDIDHHDKTVIWITGASTGIGRAVARKLAENPNNVVYASARSKEKLRELAEKRANDHNIVPLPLDVTDDKAIEKAVATIIDEHGHLDLAILNAGIYEPKSVEEVTQESIRNHYEVNVLGVTSAITAILPHFLERNKGHFAIVASVAGFRGLPKAFAYGSTKAALIHMAETLKLEVGNKGVKVQVINPGFVKTRLTAKNDFKMPMEITTDQAAEYIVKGLKKKKFEITFPPLFAFIMKIVNLLPNSLFFRLIGSATKQK